jgi:hypothetical protein
MDYSRIPCNPPTVPYLPVTPTLRVRFVYEMPQLLHKEIVHGLDRSPLWMSRNVEGDVLSRWLIPIPVVGIRGNHL